ncbi:MAG: hypothetical protein JSR72_23400 [Proteobacteria bacterium]|nr:hypothetical protein [Pseudomonadota bacterium]
MRVHPVAPVPHIADATDQLRSVHDNETRSVTISSTGTFVPRIIPRTACNSFDIARPAAAVRAAVLYAGQVAVFLLGSALFAASVTAVLVAVTVLGAP